MSDIQWKHYWILKQQSTILLILNVLFWLGEIPMGMFPALLRKITAGRNQPLMFTKERTLRNISIISAVTFSYLQKIRRLIKVCSQANPLNNRKFSNWNYFTSLNSCKIFCGHFLPVKKLFDDLILTWNSCFFWLRFHPLEIK